jgi:hypothetical protein
MVGLPAHSVTKDGRAAEVATAADTLNRKIASLKELMDFADTGDVLRDLVTAVKLQPARRRKQRQGKKP